MQLQQTQILEETFWQAVLNRDYTFEGKFFYGVRSTGIYCRPICPSRRPNRNQVCFFQSVQDAEIAGFRACKRCQPQSEIVPNTAKILAVCRYIEAQVDHIPTLSELCSQVEMSPSYLQRIFKQIIGVSPFQYADTLRSQRLKQRLQSGEEIADAVYDTGYGSSSQLYEKAPKQLGMTPKTYQQAGKTISIVYAIAPCLLGYLLVATTEKGICAVKLGDEADKLEHILNQEFHQAQIVRNDHIYKDWIQAILDFIAGGETHLDLPLDVRGTAFQKQVWQALQKIPYGETRTYTDIACDIAKPQAVRAVANACGANPTALIVPCHRVLRSDGSLGGYHWGIERKQKLLTQESKFLKDDSNT
ncbi:MAG: bifunctional DNA-binding transcriptional regulator/O6-methylguanine-DNA methyltransferase Ada [Nostoc sp. EfeVER01]|uniref:bifunctional DNA-binding transcriptional regulator/O6-methylguanine-DNA methyltransferase Ada n=1 Tax=unclassified Nostoc TaxID=2593658 RepID=UPI002AD2A5E3|nr:MULTISPECIES: bifunctional DNA-binding transcriptional regulator/O6-methylguanine-DNA methyltransferase Ada [unclassified Nostoc]MDZ7947521.1 bifunctional DNA-binding transcriptional regulator/O6-methylguanine-DNA methyltransferase Ada [Nostoc sp. EfeVER01]MDZ7995986.1 bifunctional DNA-binding transcriptional regulator/O6-methylguanine-DNA methyltransferase Ada [Nostoc sp. EspVER01]